MVAHEIGHNLGMNHDFNGNGNLNPKNPRTARNGQRCTNIGGIMDYSFYADNRNKWSACSVQDLNDYYNSANGRFCLATATGNPPSPPTCNDKSIRCPRLARFCRLSANIRRFCPKTCKRC